MARKLLPTEFYKIISEKSGSTPLRCRMVWESFVETVIEELQLYGKIDIPLFGVVYTVVKGGKFAHVPISTLPEDRGKTRQIFIEEYLVPHLKTSDTFKDNVNGRKIGRLELRRQREAYLKLVQEEKERQKKMNLIEEKRGSAKRAREIRLARIEKQKNFDKLSKKKQEEIKKKEELMEDDYDNRDD